MSPFPVHSSSLVFVVVVHFIRWWWGGRFHFLHSHSSSSVPLGSVRRRISSLSLMIFTIHLPCIFSSIFASYPPFPFLHILTRCTLSFVSLFSFFFFLFSRHITFGVFSSPVSYFMYCFFFFPLLLRLGLSISSLSVWCLVFSLCLFHPSPHCHPGTIVVLSISSTSFLSLPKIFLFFRFLHDHISCVSNSSHSSHYHLLNFVTL